MPWLVTLAEAGAVIDTSLVNEIIALVRSVMGLFSDFPMNVYLIVGLVATGFGIFGIAKRAVKH